MALGMTLLLPVALVLLAGCSNIRTEVGHPLPQVSEPFVEGHTPATVVVGELGPPHKVSALPHGFVFLYEYSLVKEFQLGLSLKLLHLPYFKVIKADSNVRETAQVLTFDEEGLLQAQDVTTWKRRLGGGGALQWVTSVQGLTDTTAIRGGPEEMNWGRASLDRPPVTLNAASDLQSGQHGLDQRMSPLFVGQATLEMTHPRPVKFKRDKTRR